MYNLTCLLFEISIFLPILALIIVQEIEGKVHSLKFVHVSVACFVLTGQFVRLMVFLRYCVFLLHCCKLVSQHQCIIWKDLFLKCFFFGVKWDFNFTLSHSYCFLSVNEFDMFVGN